MAGMVTALTAFVVTAVLGRWMVPYLHWLKYGQTILDIGPRWHKKKEGTPTMGGLMFIIGIIVASAAGYFTYQMNTDVIMPLAGAAGSRLFAGLMMAAGYGFIGFVDDYIKVVKKRNLGLTPRQKLLMQIIVAACYLLAMHVSGDRSTMLVIPLVGQIDLGLFYYPFVVFVLLAVTNAVNLTDGIDGLASCVTLVVAVGFMAVSSILGFFEINILATALAGACLGFLVWNFYPAKIFMGDTGSMFLGGLVGALAFGVGLPILLVPMGIVYVCEAGSVILQVISFKTTGKRIFKMSPIHHHFEMSGWSEMKIDLIFSLVAAAGCAIGVWLVTTL